MTNKTISDLNSRGWYRFLKVVFVITLLIGLGIFNIGAFSTGIKQLDETQTTIQCNLGSKEVLIAKDINTSLRSEDFPNERFNYKKFFQGYYNTEAIIKACYPNATFEDRVGDIYGLQKSVDIYNNLGLIGSDGVFTKLTPSQNDIYTSEFNAYKQQTGGLFGSDKAKYLDFSFHLFDIVPGFNYNGFLKLFFIGNFIILLVFEAIRRAFYYIVLGSLKPKKLDDQNIK